MRLVENIRKKLFTDLEIITQKQAEDCLISRFKVFGTLRPRVYIDGVIRTDVKAEVYNGNNKNDNVLFELKKILILIYKKNYEDVRIAIKEFSNDIKDKVSLV